MEQVEIKQKYLEFQYFGIKNFILKPIKHFKEKN